MKTCKEENCNEKHYAKGWCRYHYKMPSQIKATVRPTTNDKEREHTIIGKNKITPKKAYSIPKISKKKIEELKEYRIVRDVYLKANPLCEFPNCNSREVTLHHKRSREYYLSDPSVFMAVCYKHHEWIHSNDGEARVLGFLLSSIGN